MGRFSTSTIIADLTTWYASKASWKPDLHDKVEHFAGMVDGEEISFSSVNGQQFRWNETALQPSDWFSIYIEVLKRVTAEKAGSDPRPNAGATVNFTSLNV